MRKAKHMPVTKGEPKYLGPLTAAEVTETHAVVLSKDSDIKKVPLHISRPYHQRKQTKRKSMPQPTDMQTKKLKSLSKVLFLEMYFLS